jgi:hypothetical protein
MNSNTLMFNSGVLFYDKIILSNNCHLDNIEFNLSADENVPINLNLSSTAEFSCDVGYINTDLLTSATGEPWDNNMNFNYEYYMPIMIQARWHKKARVRKKWLRRYGMKKDQIKIRCIGTFLTLDGQDNYWDFSMNADKLEYLWRPDQLRRERKIEFVYV